MFEISAIPEEFQRKLHCQFLPKFENVLYKDPSPLLKDYSTRPCSMTDRFKDYAEAIKDFKVRPDDVWVLGHAKTGTTVTIELVSLLMSQLDYEGVEKSTIWQRSHFLELDTITDPVLNVIETANRDPNRRLMKSHLPVNLLPRELLASEDPKMIYVARNPKDAAISWYHHINGCYGFEGSLEDLLECFVEGFTLFGSLYQHIQEFMELSKLKKNLLIVIYEELLANPEEVVQKVANHLEVPLSAEELKRVVKFIHFDQMKQRKNSNMQESIEKRKEMRGIKSDFKFLRKGKKDSHKEEMPEKFIEAFNSQMKNWPEVLKIYG